MNYFKKLAGQTAVYGLSNIIGRLLSYLLVPLYTRIFEPEAYGVVTEFYSYIAFALILYTYGMETAFFHFTEKNKGSKNVFGSSFLSILISSSFISALLLLFSQGIANGLGYPEHAEYIKYFAGILFLDAATAIPFAQLRYQNKALKFAIIKLLNIFLNIGLNLFFLLLCPYLLNTADGWQYQLASYCYNPEIGVGYVFIANLISSILTLVLLLPEIFKNKLGIESALIKPMLYYALPLLLAGFAGQINETLDRIIMKHLISDPQDAMRMLGIYGANYKLSIMMVLFIQTFRYAAEPFFFSHFGKDGNRKVYADLMKYFVIFCCLIFLGILLFLDIVKFFIGDNYHEGLRIVPVLLLSHICLGIFFNLSIWYKLTGKTFYGALLTISGALVTIVFNLWLVPIIGYMGAAWATLAAYATMMVMSYILGRKVFPVPYESGKILLYILLALGLYLLSTLVCSVLSFGTIGTYSLNTLLITIFAAAAFILEKGGFRNLEEPDYDQG